MRKRPTISNEFLNEIDESSIDLLTKQIELHKEEQNQNSASQKSYLKQKRQSKTRDLILKERMTIQINKDTIEKDKNAVYWTPGLTIAQLTEEALNLALIKKEKARGGVFPQRKSELKPGRPIK